MMDHRQFDSLGRFETDWLKARHHFSFGGYHDPSRMGWGSLRVWNDDTIRAGTGFPPHPHADMEIITFVRDGAISHRDSLGHAGRTIAGDVQVMSAGSGIRHSEYNMEGDTTRIFQIWILPDRPGGEPRWDTMAFPRGQDSGRFVTLASGHPERDGGLLIRADARVLGATLKAGEAVTYPTTPDRHLYLVPSTGRVTIDGRTVEARDGLALKGVESVTITASADAEIVMTDTR
ncbi:MULTISPECIES: pirin family protein [Hyphobacterium]|uniref:Pirin family protein n=1 Tax=Hyphobacterium vulgare TaxID=1736751 RepID=A0ABV6ZZM1_9PROT